MFVYDRVPYLVRRCVYACSNTRGRRAVAGIDDPGRIRAHNFSFHFADDAFCLVVPTMDHQPTWTLRNPAPKENHNKTQRRTTSKSESPSKPNRDAARIEQHKRGGRPQRSADPVCAIENKINTAAHA